MRSTDHYTYGARRGKVAGPCPGSGFSSAQDDWQQKGKGTVLETLAERESTSLGDTSLGKLTTPRLPVVACWASLPWGHPAENPEVVLRELESGRFVQWTRAAV